MGWPPLLYAVVYYVLIISTAQKPGKIILLLCQKFSECVCINTLSAAWFWRFSQKTTAVFNCLTNALAPPPIVLESCSAAQMDRPV